MRRFTLIRAIRPLKRLLALAAVFLAVVAAFALLDVLFHGGYGPQSQYPWFRILAGGVGVLFLIAAGRLVLPRGSAVRPQMNRAAKVRIRVATVGVLLAVTLLVNWVEPRGIGCRPGKSDIDRIFREVPQHLPGFDIEEVPQELFNDPP